MPSILRFAVFVSIALSSLAASPVANAAANLQVWGRAYDYSCGYFSRRAADLSFTIQDASLPYGTEIDLIVGWGGKVMSGGGNSVTLEWVDRRVVPATAIAISTWEARVDDKSLHYRSEGRFLDSAQFTFEVRVPGQPTYWVNGGSPWGFYKIEDLYPGIQCVQNGVFPSWRALSFTAITR